VIYWRLPFRRENYLLLAARWPSHGFLGDNSIFAATHCVPGPVLFLPAL